MEVYNARDAFLYGQTLMLRREREEGLEEGRREGIQEGIERGLEEGRREGIQEGIERGLEEGRREGIQEGIRKEQITIARSLKKAGIDIKIISENTGLSVEDVLEL